MGVSQMTGTPWHLETLKTKEGEPRRHRRKCRFYDKETAFCSRISFKCGGAARCSHYEEIVLQPEEPETQPAPEPAPAPASATPQPDARRLFPKGCRVRHRRMGPGVVKKSGNETITVAFDSGEVMKLAVSVCLKNGLLIRDD